MSKFTFTMIKPDAVANNSIGPILQMINEAGFAIQAMKLTKMSKRRAKQFYGIHQGKPFFDALIKFMSEGPLVAIVLRKENAVDDYRKLIGSTDKEKAEEGTIRKKFATDVTRNAVHGADSEENAMTEARFFFSEMEIFGELE